MVIYVEGKPIFVQNPALNTSTQQNQQSEGLEVVNSNDAPTVVNSKVFQPRKKRGRQRDSFTTSADGSFGFNSNNNRPVAKIPYLLAAAAAAAASNKRKLYQQDTLLPKSHLIGGDSDTPGGRVETRLTSALGHQLHYQQQQQPHDADVKNDQEYMQLVSMFKQKNEKLSFNPLSNKSL
jgi:hypothetical protein